MTLDPVGFIGVGTIAAAMVEGLRTRWPDLPIHLSPRSETVSAALAAIHPLTVRAGSNTAVVEASRLIVLCVLPTQLDDVVTSLPFRADQIVVSCVAGTPLAEVRALVAPARAGRLVPLPMIARAEGPIILYPPLPEVHRLFEGLGTLIEVEDEQTFAAYAAGSASMSTILALQDVMMRWMADHGASDEGASAYVRSLFLALSGTAMLTPASDAAMLVGRHETPGGLNERVRRGLEAAGWFAAFGSALDGLSGLSRRDLDAKGDA